MIPLDLRARLRLLLLVPLLLLTAVACNVSFNDTFTGTEIMKKISLDGDRSAGAPLTLNLQVSQIYSVPLQIDCYYDDENHLNEDQKKLLFQERATPIGEKVLPPAPVATPTKKAAAETVSFQFSVPRPGSYFLACLTPAAAENGWGLNFTIH